MIERYQIEKAVEAFVSGPDLDYEQIKLKHKHDGFVLETIAMRMNYLKHKYTRALWDNKENAEEIFDRMCQIAPGFMLMEE